jgi:hypothetical protein
MDKKNDKIPNRKGDNDNNKISRLDFLRLLGAGAIGYFVYRAGFINNNNNNNNNLSGNATAAGANTTLPQDFCKYQFSSDTKYNSSWCWWVWHVNLLFFA